jgi:hypothetical protein
LFDKWEQDSAVKDKRLLYTPQEKAALAFWGIDKTGNKNEAKKKLESFGLPKEAAPWLYAK